MIVSQYVVELQRAFGTVVGLSVSLCMCCPPNNGQVYLLHIVFTPSTLAKPLPSKEGSIVMDGNCVQQNVRWSTIDEVDENLQEAQNTSDN